MKQYSFLQEVTIKINPENQQKLINGTKRIASGLVGAKTAAESIIETLVTKKIISLRKQIANCQTRQQAYNILLNCGYTQLPNGNKQVKLSSINYFLSVNVAGPAIQMVKNETDPNWKVTVLNYLKKMIVYHSGLTAMFGAGTAVLAKNALIKGKK